MAATTRSRIKRNNRSRPSIFRSTRRKRSGFRHLCWSLPLLGQLMGMVSNLNPAWPTEAREVAAQVAWSVEAGQDLKDRLTDWFHHTWPQGALPKDQRPPPPARAGADPFAACSRFFAGGQSPVLRPRPLQRPLCYDSFAILHSGRSRTPVFVAQKLNRRLVADADEKRTNRFFADARLPRAERAELDDYRHSGYSRGHMAPAGDMPNPTAMAQSFSLANMVPQSQRHNGGAWAKVEQDTRKYVQRSQGDVYVITGPVYGPAPTSIGANRVQVPGHVFKLVYDETTQRAWAHWHANQDATQAAQPISYRELVKRTGIEFLPGTGL